MALDISTEQHGAQDYLTDLTKCYPSKVPRTVWVKANETLYTVHYKQEQTCQDGLEL